MDTAVCWFGAEGRSETAVAFFKPSDVLVEKQARERDRTSTDQMGPGLYTAMDNKPGAGHLKLVNVPWEYNYEVPGIRNQHMQ